MEQRLDTSIIFQPVQPDLREVEKLLSEVSAVPSPQLSAMLSHIFRSGGKRLRPTITLLSGHLFHYQPDVIIPAAAAVEILHTATLVHDDVIDNSPRRRGQATINHLWGNDIAILLGDYLITAAEELAARTNNIKTPELLAQTIMAITRAEIEEDFNHFNLNKTREQYYRQINDKTAALFAAAVTAGAILGKASRDEIIRLQTYARNLGMAFQIMDDILDFTGTEEELGKPVGADLRQGTITLPVILFLEQHPGDDSLQNLCEQHNNVASLNTALQQVATSSAITECSHIAQDYCGRAKQALGTLPDGDYRQALTAITEIVMAH